MTAAAPLLARLAVLALAASVYPALGAELAPEDEDYGQHPKTTCNCSSGQRSTFYNLLQRRSRRNAQTHAQALDPNFLHLPTATLEHLPDGETACDAMRNASVIRQVDVALQPPCPVRMRLLEDPQRVWPTRLLVAECACPALSCRPRTAYVCTQIISPVVVVMAGADGLLHQHRVMLPSGCKCMTARATLVEYLDEDYK